MNEILKIKRQEEIGFNLTTNYEIAKEFLYISEKDFKSLKLLVFTSDNDFDFKKEYTISAYSESVSFYLKTRDYDTISPNIEKQLPNFLYVVELYDDEKYRKRKGSCCIKGKCKPIKKYKLSIQDKKEITNKKNTFINFYEENDFDFKANFLIELYALEICNYKLFENIISYKKNNFGIVYNEEHISFFKKRISDLISSLNKYDDFLYEKINDIKDTKDIVKFLKENKEHMFNNDKLLYVKKDNVQLKYPTNLIPYTFSISYFQEHNFNSNVPFYYQYRNYKLATNVLLNKLEEEYYNGFMKDQILFHKSMCILANQKFDTKCYEKNEDTKFVLENIKNINKLYYGLYFPLLMTFRQSVELSYKLIYLNNNIIECDTIELKDVIKNIDTHELSILLNLIKIYLNKEEFNQLNKISSFIEEIEKNDASYSRYIVNAKLDFSKLEKKTTIYITNLFMHIDNFYNIMDKVLSNIDFGFDINKTFI